MNSAPSSSNDEESIESRFTRPHSIGLVTALRNAEPWFDEMLRSVRAQSHGSWELVVVDDGSTDGSRRIAEKHASEDPRIRVASGPRRGAAAARAVGRHLLESAPAYLYFPDADDVLAPTLLKRLVDHLGSNPTAAAAYCRYGHIDAAGQLLKRPWPGRVVMSRLGVRTLSDTVAATPFHSIYAWASPVMEAIVMVRTAAYDQAGGWELCIGQGGEAVDLYSRIALDGEVHLVPETLYSYRVHDRQHTQDLGLYARRREEIRETWRQRAKTDRNIAEAVREAEFFIDHRYVPFTGLRSFLRLARESRYQESLRFLLGAMRRYRPLAPRHVR